MRTPVLFLVILLTTSFAHAQSKEQGVGYFSKNWAKVTKPTEAAYYRTVQVNSDSSAYIIRDYFVPSAKIHQEVECRQLVPSVVFHGKLKRYYLDGVLEEEGQYDQGYATGVFTKYYNTGKPCELSEYQAGNRTGILQFYAPDGSEQMTYFNDILEHVKATSEQVYPEIESHPATYSYYLNLGDTIYGEVEKIAEHPGGMQGMMNFLMKTVRYPDMARKKRIQGTVFTMFIVDEQGKISHMTIVKSGGPVLDAEVLRVIGAMKNWQPATIGGKAVKSRFVLPIKFKLGLGY